MQNKDENSNYESGTHTIAIFPNEKVRIEETLKFLRAGLDKNEVIVMALRVLPEAEVRAKMKSSWKDVDVDRLEASGDILINNPNEWYLDKDGKMNPMEALPKLTALLDESLKRGKAGVRMVGDGDEALETGFKNQFIEYERDLQKQFSRYLTVLCTYGVAAVKNAHLTTEEKQTLRSAHDHSAWIEITRL